MDNYYHFVIYCCLQAFFQRFANLLIIAHKNENTLKTIPLQEKLPKSTAGPNITSRIKMEMNKSGPLKQIHLQGRFSS